MKRIDPYELWIGSATDCRDPAAVLDAGIEAVVQLAYEEPVATLPREILLLRVPLYDGADNPPARLRLAVEIVAQLVSARIPTLVACSAGMSRSPAITACALARVEGVTPAEMLQRIRNTTGIDVSSALWRDLCAQAG